MPIPAKLAVSMETKHLMTDNRERPGRETERERESKRDRRRKTLTERDGERKTEILWNKRSNLVSEDSMKPDYVVSVNDH